MIVLSFCITGFLQTRQSPLRRLHTHELPITRGKNSKAANTRHFCQPLAPGCPPRPFQWLGNRGGRRGKSNILIGVPELYSMILRTVSAAESEPAVFHRDDFVLLIDDMKAWVVRISDIPVLEACENYTRVHFADGTALIRRSLRYCESRLDSSTFFRASRDCIVNLSHVKQTRLLVDGGLIFVLRDGKEVDFSRRQSLLFRKTRTL